MNKKRILSGMRATGPLHLGNLHGALLNWISIQEKYECFFFIADWHALTTNYEKTNSITHNVEEILLDWLSVGLDPEKSTFFVQSLIPEHAELYLYLSMITSISWLQRNPTYKDQINQIKKKDLLTHGFLGYPVLQAADILMYKTDLVPVGIDQVPHIEITREIARKFNKLYGNVFNEPNQILTFSPKILGIDRRKMSKSYDNAIYLSDSSINIKKKISKMITDPERKRRIDFGNPSMCNVFEFHKIYSKTKSCLINEQCKTAKMGCVECKKIMTTNLLKSIKPIKENRKQLEKNKKQLQEIIINGSYKARKIAKQTIGEVREAMRLNIV